MKPSRWLPWVMCLSALLMAGCGNFFQPVNSSSSNGGGGSNNGGGGGSTTTNGFLYVGNSASTTLAGFAINSSTGALSAVTNSPYNLVNFNVTAMAVTPNNAFLYVATQGVIYVYSISNGALTIGNNGTAVASSVAPGGMQVDPTGNWLVVADAFNLQVYSYPINTTNGTLTAPTSAGIAVATAGVTQPTPSAVQITPNDAYVYVSLGTAGLNIYSFNSTTGALTFTGKLASKGVQNADMGLATDANNQFLFMAETNTGLRVLSILTNGALAEVSGSPFKTGVGPLAVTVDPSNSFVYVANRGDNTISGFSLATTGALTSLNGSPYTTGSSPIALTFDQSKTFLAVICSGGSPDLQTFKLDSTTAGAPTAGKLDSVTTVSTGGNNSAGNPISLAATRFQ